MSYTALPITTDLHFQPTLSSYSRRYIALVADTALNIKLTYLLSSYKISNRLQFNSSLFFVQNSSKLCCIDTTCSKMNRTFERRLSTNRLKHIYLIHVIIEGKLVMVYQINAPLLYKTTCSESESSNFDCHEIWSCFLWKLTSFIEKQD